MIMNKLGGMWEKLCVVCFKVLGGTNKNHEKPLIG